MWYVPVPLTRDMVVMVPVMKGEDTEVVDAVEALEGCHKSHQNISLVKRKKIEKKIPAVNF